MRLNCRGNVVLLVWGEVPNEIAKGKNHGGIYKENLEETLKPLERLNPDPQLPSRLPPILEPELETRRCRSCVVLPKPLALP